ncbi:amidohydrolase family protein [Chryseobacterium daecheongense]|nr:amidohydrolase family protein [Chryseobacterium daecheongense]
MNSRKIDRKDFLHLGGKLSLGALIAPALLTGCLSDSKEKERKIIKISGNANTKYILKNGIVYSQDVKVGNFRKADILIEGKIIKEIKPDIEQGEDTYVIDASEYIIMPGFVDTHHHQYETAIRGYLAEALLVNDKKPDNPFTYLDVLIKKLTPVFRPEDIYTAVLLSSLNQIDCGVTTVLDTSQVVHSMEHFEALMHGLKDGGRRALVAFSTGSGESTPFPRKLNDIQKMYFSSTDQLLTMAMGAELFPGDFKNHWGMARDIGVPIVSHIVGNLGSAPAFENIVKENLLGKDNILIHCTGLNDKVWESIAKSGAAISLAVPIELSMRHGTPPIMQALKHGVQPSLSSDVEVTMTSDFFTQMRSVYTLQRGLVNAQVLSGIDCQQDLITCNDVVRYATLEGAKATHLEHKIGSLTPGKEADIIMLRTRDLNVMPINSVSGTVVTLMERTNVDTVIIAGKIRKYQGKMLGIDTQVLHSKITESRDYLFAKAGLENHFF